MYAYIIYSIPCYILTWHMIYAYIMILYMCISCVYHMIYNIIDSDVIYVYICTYAYHMHIIYCNIYVTYI